MYILSIGFELLMEVLLIYLAYTYWRQYKLAQNTNFLILAGAFFVLLLIDIVDAYSRITSGTEDIFETHFLLFSGLLLILVYVSRNASWKGQKINRDEETRKKNRAA